MRIHDHDVVDTNACRQAGCRRETRADKLVNRINVPLTSNSVAGSLAALGHLQRSAGNTAVVTRFFPSERKNGAPPEGDPQFVQRAVVTRGLFAAESAESKSFEGTENATGHQQGLGEFMGIDEPATQEEVGELGLTPEEAGALQQGMIDKIGSIPNVTLLLKGTSGRMPSGYTKLWLTNPAGDGKPVNLTADSREKFDEEVNQVKGQGKEPEFCIEVAVMTSSRAKSPGRVVQILNHELSAHAEPFADFLIAYAKSTEGGSWETEDEQHERLTKGIPRYELLRNRYLRGVKGDREGFGIREAQDLPFMRGYPAKRVII